MLFTTAMNICWFISLLFFETVHNHAVVETDRNALAYLKRCGYATSRCGNSRLSCLIQRPSLESMLEDFQKQFKLPITGKLDATTKQLMNRPRCGLSDRRSSSLKVASFNADLKWDKQKLTWSFRGNDATYSYWIEKAFEKWREVLPQFHFQQVCSTCNADIFLSFQLPVHNNEKGGRDDGFNSGELAHAYYLKDGTIHFNSHTKWTHSFQNLNDQYNFYLVAVHEIGHALGYLNKDEMHNIDDPSSIMYPMYSNLGKDNLFTETDQQAMRKIYPDVSNGDGNFSPTLKEGRRYGGTGGVRFTDSPYACDLCYPINIKVAYGAGIDFIEMTYTSDSSDRSVEVEAPRHGTFSHNLRTGSFRILSGDKINKIYVTYANIDPTHPHVIIVTGIQFHTVKGRSSHFFGNNTGLISVEEFPGYYLHYISGRSGAHLDQLRFHWRNI